MELLTKIFSRYSEYGGEISLYDLKTPVNLLGTIALKAPISYGRTIVNGTSKIYRRDFN